MHFYLTTYSLTRENRTISQIDEKCDKTKSLFLSLWIRKSYRWVGEILYERRFHESLDNLTPRDVYLGQGEKIKKIREIIKQNSINKRIFHFKMDDRLLVIFYALGNILFAAFFDVGSLRLQQDGDLRKTLLELLHFYLSIH